MKRGFNTIIGMQNSHTGSGVAVFFVLERQDPSVHPKNNSRTIEHKQITLYIIYIAFWRIIMRFAKVENLLRQKGF